MLGLEAGHDMLIRFRCLARGSRGYSVLELMVVVTCIALALMLAVPSLQGWLVNGRVRIVAEALLNGLRMAHVESVRQSRQTVFMLTNDAPDDPAAAADANGGNWAVRTVPLLTGEATRFVRGGALAELGTGVSITGSGGAESICFNSIGGLVANPDPGPSGAACAIDPAAPTVTYDIAAPGADRPLRVLVSLGGRIRMCDPAKALATNPDGCS